MEHVIVGYAASETSQQRVCDRENPSTGLFIVNRERLAVFFL